MGIYQKANDLAIRMNGKFDALIAQAEYQSQVLHSIMVKLDERSPSS
jgi:hypothetical protein